MKFRRWRLATLMGLVGLGALGIKGALLLLPKHDIVRDRLAGQGRPGPFPDSPEIREELVARLADPEARVRDYALLWLANIGATEPAMIPKLVGHLMTETSEYRGFHLRHLEQLHSGQALLRFQLPASTIAPLLRPAMTSAADDLVRAQALVVLAEAAGRAGRLSDPTLVTLLLGALDDRWPKSRLHAAEGLARLDGAARSRAVAVLIRQLRGSDRPEALVAAANLTRFDPEGRAGAALLAERLDRNPNDAATRIMDLYLLARLGPLSRSAVPAIVHTMTNGDPHLSANLALGNYWPRTTTHYWDFDNTDVFDLEALGVMIRAAGRPADHSGSSQSAENWMGAICLGQIGPEAEREAVAILTGMLRGDDERRRFAAAEALGRLGPQARSAFPELLAFVERTTSDPPRNLNGYSDSAQAMRALRRICRPGDPELVATLTRLLGAGSHRTEAARILAELDPPAPSAIPALIGALRDEWQSVRTSAAWALRRYAGREREAIVVALGAILDDPEVDTRVAGAEALLRLEADPDRAVSVLIAALRSDKPLSRHWAVSILGQFGPAARAAVPALRSLRSDPDEVVRIDVVQALKAIEAPTP